jgi:7-carboxy-7-deazaguanine synthase
VDDPPALRTLLVSEVFGPTIQGEGKSLGMPCAFLRLGACNLSCTWCDTPYTWDWKGQNGTKFDPKEELTTMTFSEVAGRLQECSPGGFNRNVVLTGGEPMLQQESLIKFTEYFQWYDTHQMHFEMETAGTILPVPKLVAVIDQFNVSPKLSNSGNLKTKRYKPEVLDLLAQLPNATFKFVVSDVEDFKEVDELVRTHRIDPPKVYIMPEGVNAEKLRERQQELVIATIARGYNLTARLHIEIFGNRRGR